jgi:fatty acid desaturase
MHGYGFNSQSTFPTKDDRAVKTRLKSLNSRIYTYVGWAAFVLQGCKVVWWLHMLFSLIIHFLLQGGGFLLQRRKI